MFIGPAVQLVFTRNSPGRRIVGINQIVGNIRQVICEGMLFNLFPALLFLRPFNVVRSDRVFDNEFIYLDHQVENKVRECRRKLLRLPYLVQIQPPVRDLCQESDCVRNGYILQLTNMHSACFCTVPFVSGLEQNGFCNCVFKVHIIDPLEIVRQIVIDEPGVVFLVTAGDNMRADDKFLPLVHFLIGIDVLGDVRFGKDLVLGIFLVKCSLARLGESFFLPHGFVLATGSLKEPVCLQRTVGRKRGKRVS